MAVGMRRFLLSVTMGSSFIIFSTLYLSNKSYYSIRTLPLIVDKPSRLFMEDLRVARPMSLPKEWTSFTAHPFCPNLQARQRRRHTSYENHIPSHVTWTSLLDMTDPKFTQIHIARPSRDNFTDFLVCDELRLLIQAMNGRNESKTYGGDYFRAKMYTKNSTFQASSTTDGEVVDHGNGTYSAFFTLKWAGVVKINVTLVHVSEANYVLQRLQREEVIRTHFSSQFYSDDPKKAEETYCNIHLNTLNRTFSKNETCNFTDATTGAPWFCVKPPNFSCSDRVAQHSATSIGINTSTIEQLAFQWNDQLITGGGDSLVVHYMPGQQSVVHSGSLDQLPTCKPMVHFGKPEVAGFYWGKYWHSAECRTLQFTETSASLLLKNKTIYFFGDSTIRQLFEFYVNLFKLKTVPVKRDGNWYVGPTSARDGRNNIDLRFQFHGNPIGRKSWAKVANIDYISNLIDRIEGGKNTILVLSLWAHFGPSPPWYYEARIHDVLEAIRRLHERSPESLVVWKSANTREHHAMDHYLKFSDWNARDLDRRMRNKVLSYENVGFLDAWDMTNAQFDKDTVHPVSPHAENLSNKLLTYVLHHNKSL